MKQPPITEQLLKQLRDNPGLHVLLIGHIDSCPGAHGRPDQCNCTPHTELVSGAELVRQTTQRQQPRTPRGRPR